MTDSTAAWTCIAGRAAETPIRSRIANQPVIAQNLVIAIAALVTACSRADDAGASQRALGARPLSAAARAGKRYHDLGVCGPQRDDHTAFPEFCGLFKTPTLRNVATRGALFHNGVIHSLEQAIRFYNTRDTWPEIWYPTVGGRAKPKPDPDFPRYGLITTQYVGGALQKYDDLPPAHRQNLDAQLPLDGRAAGSEPPMTEQQVRDLICFLRTLTDEDQTNTVAPFEGCSA